MHLIQCRKQLSQKLAAYNPRNGNRLELRDPFLATSVLQKSLRRADGHYAHAAAQALLEIDPTRFWRRLVISVCEDFGLSDMNLTIQVIAAASDKAWRNRCGGDAHVADYLIKCLLARPRDRRTDELYMLAVKISRSLNPDLTIKELKATESLRGALNQALALVLRCEWVVPNRGVRAILARQCDTAIARMAHEGWIDRGLEAALMQARRTSQCLLPVLLPLLKYATKRRAGQACIVTRPPPQSREIDGLPSYAFDGYTRPGRAALMTLARQHRPLSRLLSSSATSKARMDALVSLLFVVEGGVCSYEISDPFYDELKLHSLGCWSGLPKPVLDEGLAIMADALPTLTEIRSDLLGVTAMNN